MQQKAVIVGGGLAGLCAARRLHESGVEFLLIEARDRLGGRISTVDAAGRPSDDGFDLGPSWFWPQMQPAIATLIGELGLASFAQSSDGDVIFERMSRERPQRYSAVLQEPQSFRIVGGTAALVRALAETLPPQQVMLAARLTGMTLVDDGVELAVHRGREAAGTILASHVIAAMPPRLLEASVLFSPEQKPAIARLWRETPTWMAPHAKFFAIYDHPFWRDAGMSGTAHSMVGPMPEIHDATTASGHAALFGFIGMGAGQRSSLGEAALTKACIGQLARIFGAQAAHPRATLMKDWAADRLTATSADPVDAGHPAPFEGRWVDGPWLERLTVAGSETSVSEPGYLAGAVVAGERAAAEAIARLCA